VPARIGIQLAERREGVRELHVAGQPLRDVEAVELIGKGVPIDDVCRHASPSLGCGPQA
jgi:hypothetical protein